MSDRDWLAEKFEGHRAHLQRVAYRMLGTVDESDDAVQETWLRLSRTDEAAIENLGGWLTTVVGRVCLDMLRARRSRHEDYAGSWLPEPIVEYGEHTDPEHEALLADSVGLALLVVLETLTPAERLSFVLHDMFGISFEEIAPIVDRTPANARQLASRARRRVRGAEPEPDADLAAQRTVVDAFLAAARAGDFAGLIAVLDPDAVFRMDAGIDSPLTRRPVEGAEAVAGAILARGAPFAPLARPAVVNGAAGAIVGRRGRPLAVAGFTIAGGRITAIDIVIDPEKLPHIVLD
ncbi:MAG TPA: RNA polymerase sigma factor SigJ [Gaiellaceae bacterium]|jgi:RNA polymerase sigma-70 factor (ECF subfamily)|nr:RNA polymerase sigma factor SigJ [Gaiellaceae bacterium]